jgi:DNA-binding MarR family transcriptional regulator
VRKSDERRKIVTVLKESGDPIGPKSIAELTGMKAANVRKLLGKMVKSGK